MLLAHHYAFLRLIALAAPRRLRLHRPGCPCLGADETQILSIMGAFERDDAKSGLKRLADLIGPDITGQMLDLARDLSLLYARPDTSHQSDTIH